MKLVNLLFALTGLLLLGALGIAYVQLAEHDALLILHFDSYRGIDFLGSKFDVFNIIFVGFGIGFLNYLLSRAMAKKELFFSKLLAGASAFFALLIFIAVAVIIAIN